MQLAILVGLMLGCGQPFGSHNFPRISNKSNLTMSLRRTACFGACPDYMVTITGTGKVEYEGGRYVCRSGKQQWQLPPEKVDELIKAFRKAKFFDLRDRYVTDMNDLPAAQTSFEVDGRKKTVLHYGEEQKALSELEDSIDRIAGTLPLVSVNRASNCEAVKTERSLGQ